MSAEPEQRHGIVDDLLELAVPIARLHELPGNPNVGDVTVVAQSYERFGQRKPITAQPDGTVTAGNTQLRAAQRLGWTHIAVVWTDDDDQTARAWALVDNRTSDLGTENVELLRSMLESINDQSLLVGYDDAELLRLLQATDRPDYNAATHKIPENPVTRLGDVWEIGPHRIMCGDARDPSAVAELLDGAKVNLAFTSPPYAEAREYDEESEFEPVPPERYVDWFEPVVAAVRAALAPDGSWVVNVKPGASGLDTSLYVHDLVAAHVRRWGWHFATEFCWERIGVPKHATQRLKNQFEPIYQFALGEWKFRPRNVQHWSPSTRIALGPGSHAQGWTERQGDGSVIFTREQEAEGWAYPGNRLPTFAGSYEATGHPAAFPVGLAEFFVRLFTDRRDAVYDPFLGSGSTLCAALQGGRIGFGMELSPRYVDVSLARLQRLSGQLPTRWGEAVDFDR